MAVLRKELLDTLRDRRTLIAMLVVPLLVTPMLMIGVARYSQSRAQEAREQTLKVAVVDPHDDSGIADHLDAQPGIDVFPDRDVTSLSARIAAEELDAAVLVDENFQREVAALHPGGVSLLFKSSDRFDQQKSRLKDALAGYEQKLLDRRFAALKLGPDVVHAVRVQEHDVASAREQIGQRIGGLLPYMFILFCFTGGMYPAIDLAAGEKERGTLETLLTAPVQRWSLVLGKFLVVTLTGIISALIAMLGLYLTVSYGIEGLPPELLGAIGQVLEPGTIAAVFALLVPLAMFFAALLLMLSIYARSYKEAVSIISPLTIVVLVPAILALVPGTRLTVATALVPVLNVSLATRELVAGTASPALVALVFASLIALAGASLLACSRWFAREDVVFRT
jgi:sodium transport system permease protein